MKHVIIGTAGHVDHGKTALIQALTGIDTDRLKEEKERGISIDLGFASLLLNESIQAGIVDVPGHERFLKNMLAGTGGLDLVILVIAADEGIMPQTKEHLAMLELYGICHGLLVITKCDKVDAEWLAMIEEDVACFLTGTFLEGAPVCRVSALTGQGLAELKSQLASLAEAIPYRDAAAPFRLWVDRAFTVKGYGVVVTGTVLSGTAAIGDGLALYPSGKMVKIRGLESHGKKLQSVYAGQRAAINLSGVDLSELGRGMSLSHPARGEVSRLWDVAVDWRQPVETGCRVRLHIGTGEFIGRIYRPQKAPKGQYRLSLEQAIGAGAGDRGILRQYSPQHLLGGLVLLGTVPENSRSYPDKKEIWQAAQTKDGERMVAAILACQQLPVPAEVIRRQAGYMSDTGLNKGLKILSAQKQILSLGQFYLTAKQMDVLKEKVLQTILAYHVAYTTRPGMPKEELRQKLELGDKEFEAILSYLGEKGLVRLAGGEVSHPSHAEKHQDWRENIALEAEELLAGIGLENIDAAFIAEKKRISTGQAQKYLEALVKEGIVVRVGSIHVYRKTIQYIVEVIRRHFTAYPTLTVAELRDILNTSRKFALPILEYLDMNKYTVRDGDVRRAGARLQDLSEKTIF